MQAKLIMWAHVWAKGARRITFELASRVWRRRRRVPRRIGSWLTTLAIDST